MNNQVAEESGGRGVTHSEQTSLEIQIRIKNVFLSCQRRNKHSFKGKLYGNDENVSTDVALICYLLGLTSLFVC